MSVFPEEDEVELELIPLLTLPLLFEVLEVLELELFEVFGRVKEILLSYDGRFMRVPAVNLFVSSIYNVNTQLISQSIRKVPKFFQLGVFYDSLENQQQRKTN